MIIDAEKIKELLVTPGLLDEKDFNLAVKESSAAGISLVRYLTEQKMVPDEHLGKTIADAFEYRFVDLKKSKISDDLLDLIPEAVAQSQQAIVFEKKETKIKLAIANPDNLEFIKFLEKKTGSKIEVYYATPLGIDRALRYYENDVYDQVKALLSNLKTNSKDEQNIIELVNLFLKYAHDNSASDIHIEPMEDMVSVRFRIDGVLHEAVEYPIELHDRIVSRIKFLSRLRTDEHAAAQDGRFDYTIDDTRFDVRTSILPITHGENVVMRLLAESSNRLPLEDLGLSGEDLEKVKRAATKPFGMLLVTGPTGSGKTTTLYGVLQILNKPEVNIMTIEDPVEYSVRHVQQTQVNPKKDLTFATGLRSIVRQDPNVIMVGEIRDKETAEIAVNAAMTGHLLLSTLHTNDAATAFPRLMDMEVEPFLVSSSVNIVIAQRLVRKICENCRASCTLDKTELRLIEKEENLSKIIEKVSGKNDFSKITFFKGKGCRACAETGYVGRTAIFETMEINDDLRSLISQKAPAEIINAKAIELGMTSMVQDGVRKVFEGVTTIEEILRNVNS